MLRSSRCACARQSAGFHGATAVRNYRIPSACKRDHKRGHTAVATPRLLRELRRLVHVVLREDAAVVPR
jgi:hypothetical protein